VKRVHTGGEFYSGGESLSKVLLLKNRSKETVARLFAGEGGTGGGKGKEKTVRVGERRGGGAETRGGGGGGGLGGRGGGGGEVGGPTP